MLVTNELSDIGKFHLLRASYGFENGIIYTGGTSRTVPFNGAVLDTRSQINYQSSRNVKYFQGRNR